MLQGRLELHNCRDVEALCNRILNQAGGHDLPWHKREEALAWLVAACWELSLDYQPELDQNGTQGFAGWAARTLRRRYVDWVRTDRGRTIWKFEDRTYERQRPQLLSLDAISTTTETNWVDSIGNADGGGLVRLVGQQSVDPAEHRSPDLMRALRKGDRPAARAVNPVGERPSRRAA